MNIIKIFDTAQIGTVLLVIAFLLLYIAFGKRHSRNKDTN